MFLFEKFVGYFFIIHPSVFTLLYYHLAVTFLFFIEPYDPVVFSFLRASGRMTVKLEFLPPCCAFSSRIGKNPLLA